MVQCYKTPLESPGGSRRAAGSRQSGGVRANNVSDVTCSDGQNPVVKRGDTFQCEANIDRVKWLFAATFQDDDGHDDAGYPR